MSVANETGNSEAYRRLRYPELLELLCRVAKYMFKENKSESSQLPFIKQLEYTLD